MPSEYLIQRIDRLLHDNRPRAQQISKRIHEHPELQFAEHLACRELSTSLAEAGFSVETPLAGLDTAFRASMGEGGPTVAILCEYDALPEIGHGCGHNLIAAGGWLAGLAVGQAWTGPGQVQVIGTPAEEGGGGKIIQLRAGVFDRVDAVLMFHPTDHTRMIRHATASQKVRVAYRGRAAHAAGSPHEGRSALAAIIQLFTAVDSMRQFTTDTTRIHGVITNGGVAPNIVPEFASAEFQIREVDREGVEQLMRRFIKTAEGCALATGTRLEIETCEMYAERKNNHTMAERTAQYLQECGIEVEPPVLRGGTGSSDIGNVSLAVPTIHPYLKIMPSGVPTHSRDMAGYAATDGAFAVTITMARALALTAVDLLEDHRFLTAVQTEFNASTPDYPS